MVWKLLAVALALTLIVGLAAIASGAGTTTDPLVTLSYLENQFRPSVLSAASSQTAAARTQLESNLDSRINAFRYSLPTVMSSTPVSSDYMSVTLAPEEVCSLTAGMEVLFLEGSAVANAAGLTDTSIGQTLAAGGALSVNHLYLVTYDCTVTATDHMKMLVR